MPLTDCPVFCKCMLQAALSSLQAEGYDLSVKLQQANVTVQAARGAKVIPSTQTFTHTL